jgi:DNA-binding transcriptional LysR family regulator
MPVNLPTNLLRNFVAIVETGSMLSASSTVFVTQSALSLQIKRLEDLLQQDLFHRDGRRLRLTPAGEVLLTLSRRLLRLHDEAVATMADMRSALAERAPIVPELDGWLASHAPIDG